MPTDREGDGRLYVTEAQGEDEAGMRLGERIISFTAPIILLCVWEGAVRLGWLDSRFFPAPSLIALRLFEMSQDGSLAAAVGISLARVVAGFLLGAIPSIVIGLSMGLFRVVRATIEPIVAVIYPIPMTAVVPLLMLIFGIGETFKVVTIALGSFPLVVLNSMSGVLGIDPIYVDVARNLGASRRDIYRTVALPGALPFIFTGLRLSVGVSLLLITSAEMVGARSGLGYLIWRSYQVFDIPTMFVGLVVLSALGWLFMSGLTELERRIVPWRAR